tara:strand:- start:2429 stop:2782 length:354 start_codon:yes stop_codon:yes gene_type:complete
MIRQIVLTFSAITLLFSFQSSLENRLYSLNRQLMCPVCDGLTLEQSQADDAVEMREEIKKMVIKGMTDQEIKDYYVEKYGIYILADPPKTGFDTLVFIGPILFGFLGLIILYRYLFS